MVLHGLPDFQAETTLPDGPAWAAFGRSSVWLAPPTGALLAEASPGAPAFQLSITRPMAPFLPPAPYAVLDVGLAAGRDTAAALTGLRERWPRATLQWLEPSSGRARLAPAPGSAPVPGDLDAVTEIAWNGLGTTRYIVRLGIDAANVLAETLETGALPLQFGLALAFDGVSPRLPERVRFDPADLLASLGPEVTEGVTLADLAATIRGRLADLPLDRTGGGAGSDAEFAAALADRLAARFATPAATPGLEPALRFPAPGDAGSGRFEWDLSEPVAARRWITLAFDPFDALRAFIAERGAGPLITRSTSQPVPTGRHRIYAFANLPERRVGIEALGVTIRADPNPPHRPHAAVATAMIAPPSDDTHLELQLAPGEAPAYATNAFAVIADSRGVLRLDGPGRLTDGLLLRLVPDDFALAVVALEAAPDLLAQARIDAEASYRHEGVARGVAFGLDAAAPSCALGLPAGAEDAAIHVTATERNSGATLDLGRLPARSTRFELTSFASFGPQRATIRLEMAPDAPLLALDVAAEDRPEAEAETLTFTAASPERHWSYFAISPFRGGFRWRLHAAPGAPPAPWRLHASAAVPLAPRLSDLFTFDTG